LKPTEKSWNNFSAESFPEVATIEEARKALDAAQQLVGKVERFFCPVIVHDQGIVEGLESNSKLIRKSFSAFRKLISAKELKNRLEIKAEPCAATSSSRV